jgi:hypothetical protein
LPGDWSACVFGRHAERPQHDIQLPPGSLASQELIVLGAQLRLPLLPRLSRRLEGGAD